MKNCETCGIEVVIVMTPFADECTGFIGENGVTCLKCAGLVEDAFSDVDYDHDYEDNAETMEREYHDRKMELYDMWKKEY